MLEDSVLLNKASPLGKLVNQSPDLREGKYPTPAHLFHVREEEKLKKSNQHHNPEAQAH